LSYQIAPLIGALHQHLRSQINHGKAIPQDGGQLFFNSYIDKAEETVAELTYQKAFEIYGNPLPDIVDLRIEKELTSILGDW